MISVSRAEWTKIVTKLERKLAGVPFHIQQSVQSNEVRLVFNNEADEVYFVLRWM